MGIKPNTGKRIEHSSIRIALTEVSDVPTPARAARPLRVTEKEFLKCCKRVREIMKLEASPADQNRDKARTKKLEKKAEAIQELETSAQYLPGDSELLSKNADIVKLLESQHS